MRAVRDQSQKLSEFLAWLDERGIHLCEVMDRGPREGEFSPLRLGYENLLARYFEIDLKKIEEERRALLDEQRALNARGGS